MLSKGKTIEQQQHMYPGMTAIPSAQSVAKLMPQAARYSLHLPTLQSHENALRILQFVESECDVLPSKERCPFLVVAELIEQPYTCGSDQLYSDGLINAEQISMGIDHQQQICDVQVEENPSSPPENVFMFARDEENVSPHHNAGYENPEDINNPFAHNAHSWDEMRGGAVQPEENESNSRSERSRLEDYMPFINRGGQQYDGYGSYHFSTNPYDKTYAVSELYQSPDSLPGSAQYPPSASSYVTQTQPPPWNHYNPPERKVFMKARTWVEKKQMIQRGSAFGHLPGWTVRSFIVKSGDDLRKEVVAMQLIEFFRNIFYSEGLDISLRPYRILSTGHMSGLVEFLEGCRSIDSIKKSCTTPATIRDYFEFCFGASYSPIHGNAVQNFVKSLVGYSLVTYVLQVKDRHNANIMLDTDGHIIHIDFGFIFGDSPGFNMNFENAPFKLTREYIDAMGGLESEAFKNFEDLFVRGFFALQKHVDAICTIVQMFYGPRRRNAADALRSRLLFARNQDDVIGLIRESLDSWRTKQYDWFQQRTNGILM